MRLSFLREPETVYLGGLSVGAGPLRAWWGVFGRWGRYYLVPPLSFLGLLQLGGALSAEGYLPLLGIAPELWPAGVLRALAPIIVGAPIPARILSRATPAQLAALGRALARVNDWPRLADAMKPGDGKTTDEDAFDINVAWIGKAFGIWPYEVMDKPYVEVEAVREMLHREAGGVSKDTADAVKDAAVKLDDERRRADEKLRSLGIEVPGA